MKPTNIYKHGCDPISSNCVIWQGPDIDCIDLCKGDTVSDVVYALALELCKLIDTFDLSNYDLSCFNLAECAPADFQAFMQLLIDKVCECCDVTPTPGPTPGTSGCPDCEVTICESFYYLNPQGDTLTTMQLTDYVSAIGNRVCSLIQEIAAINLVLQNHESRIVILENADPATYTPPQVIPCSEISLPNVPTGMEIALQQLMDQYCTFVSAVGTVPSILGVIGFECDALSSSPQLALPIETMSQLTGWETAPVTLEDSLRNMWLTICDMRAAILNIQNNCCDTGCDTISLIWQGQRAVQPETTIELFLSGSVPNNLQNSCTNGSTITITDSNGGSITFNNVNANLLLNNPAGIAYPLAATPVNTALELTILIDTCWTDPTTGSECSLTNTVVLSAPAQCPTITLQAFASDPNGTVAWEFIFTGTNVPTTLGVQLWNAGETVLISSQTIPVATNGQTLTGTFAGLTQNETYKIRLMDSSGNPCPFVSYLVPGGPCEPPVITSTGSYSITA
jgi:hypothetical protein